MCQTTNHIMTREIGKGSFGVSSLVEISDGSLLRLWKIQNCLSILGIGMGFWLKQTVPID